MAIFYLLDSDPRDVFHKAAPFCYIIITNNVLYSAGYVEGYARRFWQGNETHRGQPGQPGRVATLVEEGACLTHGMALELKGEEALDYLNNRQWIRHTC